MCTYFSCLCAVLICAAIDDVPGELSNLDNVDIAKCLQCINTHRDHIVGVKVRLSAQLANNGENEAEGCRLVESCDCHVMISCDCYVFIY